MMRARPAFGANDGVYRIKPWTDRRMSRLYPLSWHSMSWMSWQSSARLIALACWATAFALTGGMGWHAWSIMQDTAPGAYYTASQVDTAITAVRLAGNDAMTGTEKQVAP
tara:strand:- start:21130 stop:21459 length:330 start_codon:yes stop_codon:yes gene_type:complete